MKITTKTEALNIVETSYLASLSSLLWVATHNKEERDAKYEVSTIFSASVFVVIFIFC